MNISPEAVAGMYLRVTKQGSTPVDVKNFLAANPHFQVVDERNTIMNVNLKDKKVSASPGGTIELKWNGQGTTKLAGTAGSAGTGGGATP